MTENLQASKILCRPSLRLTYVLLPSETSRRHCLLC